jgi:predicted Zn-dependent protease
VQAIACRLGAEHCADIRVYIVATPLFNASMAPNGMMQVWSGLLLRMENEAQLAAILGHEIGHYLQRHSVERLRDVKSRSAFGQFLGLFGLPGIVGQLALLASMFAYSREQELEADRVGVQLMHQAGYDTREAARVWDNLLLEVKAKRAVDGESRNPLFATHPAPEDRQAMLAQLTQTYAGGEAGEAAWQKALAPHRHEWLLQEIKRQQPEESLALLNRLVERFATEPEHRYARGEIYRLRAGADDLERALADHQAAAALGGEPAETHRALGLIYRARNQTGEARASFERYLTRAPEAPDAGLVKAYLAELGS